MAQVAPSLETSGTRSFDTAYSGIEYRPRSPEDTVVHRVVVEHLETFLDEARARDGGHGVPEFVERAFRKLIECGCLGRGFARVRCQDCGFERLVPFSCKTRNLCGSCSGRRMTELSAHLLDSVLPIVPIRQWVLTLPYRVRYALAWDHKRALAVLSVFNRALEGFYRDKAKAQGIVEGRTGSVTTLHRVGSALNLNPHFHMLCLDGVFTQEPDGSLTFHPIEPLTDDDVATLLATVRCRVIRLLEREGVLDDDLSSFQFDPLSEESPSLAGISSASVRGRVAMGQRSGRKVMKIGSDPDAPWVTSRSPLQGHLEGFDLHAGMAVKGQDRERLERLCRYILRPPVVQDRLELLDDGKVMMELKQPFWDGTTHILFEPLEFMEKLTTLIVRPRVNQLIYHGLLGPNAAWRKAVVSYGREVPATEAREDDDAADEEAVGDSDSDSELPVPRRRSYTYAELMARAFLIDVLECPRCRGRMKLIALIEEPRVVGKILDHLGLSTTIPSPAPSRSPPVADIDESYFA